jgi:protease I
MVPHLAKVLMVISEKGFRDEEFSEPFRILKESDHIVTIASSSAGEAQGKLGMRVKPDVSLGSFDPSGYDAVVVVGGPGTPAYLWPNKALHTALATVYSKGGIVAAICLAPVAFARSGLIKGKKCTVFQTPESVHEMESAGCLLQKDHVIVDGKIITADGPAAATAFGEAILKLLNEL